jgi:uncharacterized protein (DUF1684 family)
MAALSGVEPWQQSVEQWRADYEAGLKAPNGWLSVAGLSWLHEGDNEVEHIGVVKFHAGVVTFGRQTLRPDSNDVARVGDITMSIIVRGGKTGVRLRDPNAESRRNFTGCTWYPISEAWHVTAKWVPYAQPKKIAITNILGMTEQEDSPGYAEFAVNHQTMRLEPVVEDGQLFFMFKDATSGGATYGAGRFLYAAMPKDGAVDLDFNKAKNPPCAFTAYATCPLPPRQNKLPIAVEAGEKTYGHH